MSINELRASNRRRSWQAAWSDHDVEVLRDMAAAGLSASVIGDRLGRSRNSVIGKTNRLGITLSGSKSRYWSKDRLQDLKAAYINGHTKQEIVEMLGGSERTLKDAITAIRAEGIRPPAPRAPAIRRTRYQTFVKRERPRDSNPVEPSGECAVLLLDLASHHCRWPTGEAVGAGQYFCGADNGGDGSYCQYHWQRSIGHPA